MIRFSFAVWWVFLLPRKFFFRGGGRLWEELAVLGQERLPIGLYQCTYWLLLTSFDRLSSGEVGRMTLKGVLLLGHGYPMAVSFSERLLISWGFRVAVRDDTTYSQVAYDVSAEVMVGNPTVKGALRTGLEGLGGGLGAAKGDRLGWKQPRYPVPPKEAFQVVFY